jgi:hypothetical protein
MASKKKLNILKDAIARIQVIEEAVNQQDRDKTGAGFRRRPDSAEREGEQSLYMEALRGAVLAEKVRLSASLKRLTVSPRPIGKPDDFVIPPMPTAPVRNVRYITWPLAGPTMRENDTDLVEMSAPLILQALGCLSPGKAFSTMEDEPSGVVVITPLHIDESEVLGYAAMRPVEEDPPAEATE